MLRRAPLAARLARRLAAVDRRGGRCGVAVLERGAVPKIRFALGHTEALPSASLAKLFTAAAALDTLGPGHMFATTLTARGDVDEGGTLHGDLVVHGTGAPTIGGRLHDGECTRVLDEFASTVVRAGIRRIAGAVVLDDGAIDRTFVHDSWALACAGRSEAEGVAGLMFNESSIHVRLRGGAVAGQPAVVDVPSTLGPWGLDARVETRRARGVDVEARWSEDRARLRIHGTLGRKKTVWLASPVPDPLAFFGHAFLSCLRRQDVTVSGGTRPARDRDDRVPGAGVLARQEAALPTILGVMNGSSQNAYAAVLFKACGAAAEGRGTWESGRRAVATMLRRRGLDPEGQTCIVDGSGVSLDNRTTAETVARLLVAMENDDTRGEVLAASLAVPGRNGTLRTRLVRGGLPDRLRAKTGTHRGIHAMAGYVDGIGGAPGHAFAAILEGVPQGAALIDGLVREIAR